MLKNEGDDTFVFEIQGIEHLLGPMDGSGLDHARMPAHSAVELALGGKLKEAKILKETAIELEQAMPVFFKNPIA